MEVVFTKTVDHLTETWHPRKDGKKKTAPELLCEFAVMFAANPSRWPFERKIDALGFFHGLLVVVRASAECAKLADRP
jgi:hypothetical protein